MSRSPNHYSTESPSAIDCPAFVTALILLYVVDRLLYLPSERCEPGRYNVFTLSVCTLLIVYYICQVNGVNLADIMFLLSLSVFIRKCLTHAAATQWQRCLLA